MVCKSIDQHTDQGAKIGDERNVPAAVIRTKINLPADQRIDYWVGRGQGTVVRKIRSGRCKSRPQGSGCVAIGQLVKVLGSAFDQFSAESRSIRAQNADLNLS